MKYKAVEVTMLIINSDEVPLDEMKYHIENVKYPNRCLSPQVIEMREKDIGEWDDDHPLNQSGWEEEYVRLFRPEIWERRQFIRSLPLKEIKD